MSGARSRTFRSGNSEAVRLPKDMGFGADVEVSIHRSGDVVTITPVKPPVADLVARLQALPRPPAVEARDVEPLPEPPGL